MDDYADLIADLERGSSNLAADATMQKAASAIAAQAAELARLQASQRSAWNAAADLDEKLERVTAERDAAVADARLAAFGAWAAEEFREDLGDVDGGSAQDAMERCGVLVAIEVTEPCGEECRCAEYGDWPMQCYRYAPGIREAIDAARRTEQEQKHG